jgi:hypothetical protein
MKYKLKNVNGKVTFLLKTGKDFVRNTMSISAAQHIIDNGKITDSDKNGYPICVDEKWYFEGEPVNTTRKKEE